MSKIKKSIVFMITLSMILSTIVMPSAELIPESGSGVSGTPIGFPSGGSSGGSSGGTGGTGGSSGSTGGSSGGTGGSTGGSSGGSSGGYVPSRSVVIDFFSEQKTDFEDPEEAAEYIDYNFGGLLPPKNLDGLDLNLDELLETGYLFYGDKNSPQIQHKGGTNGIPLTLGRTVDGKDFSNLKHPEPKMEYNLKLIDQSEYHTISPVFSTFKSELNKPEFVGAGLYPDKSWTEQKELGDKTIDLWMKNIKNRIPEFLPRSPKSAERFPENNNGRPIQDEYTLAEMRTRFQVDSPPTPKSYGTAIAWFTHNGEPNGTHRTFLIDKIPEFDIIGNDFTYDEDSKIITFNYDIEGFKEVKKEDISNLVNLASHAEKFDGVLDITSYHGVVEGDTRLVQDHGAPYLNFMYYKDEINYPGFGASDRVEVDASGSIPDFRLGDIEVFMAFNTSSDGIIDESNYKNNEIVGIIPKSLADLVMKDVEVDVVSEDEVDVLATFEMDKGPEEVPSVDVEFIYTFTDGTTGSDIVTVNDVELNDDVEAEYTINAPSGKVVQSVSAEVNYDKNLYSLNSIYIDESDYDNNILDTMVGKAFDFSIDAVNNSKVFESDEDINIGLNATLANSSNPLDTESYAFKLS